MLLRGRALAVPSVATARPRSIRLCPLWEVYCFNFTFVAVPTRSNVFASSVTSATSGDNDCLDPPAPGVLPSSFQGFSVFIHCLSLFFSPPWFSFASAMLATASFLDAKALMSLQELAVRAWALPLPLSSRATCTCALSPSSSSLPPSTGASSGATRFTTSRRRTARCRSLPTSLHVSRKTILPTCSERRRFCQHAQLQGQPTSRPTLTGPPEPTSRPTLTGPSHPLLTVVHPLARRQR